MKASADKMSAVAALLEGRGVRVVEEPGWAARGYRDRAMRYDVWGGMCHHTAGARKGPFPSRRVLLEGRSSLPPPLCNFGLERGPDPAVRLMAAGLANHAGKGSWPGISSGAYQLWGIEAENVGDGTEPWESYPVYVLLGWAITRVVGPGAVLIGHLEWAKPKGRKVDPAGFDMDDYRRDVAAVNDAQQGGNGADDVRLKEAAGEIDELYFARRGSYPSPKERKYWVGLCAAAIFDGDGDPEEHLKELRVGLVAEPDQDD